MAAPVIVHGLGASAKYLTLDISEPQFLREVSDGDRHEWLHYFLALRPKPGLWVTVDADGKIAADDLGGGAEIPLSRKAEFPTSVRPLRCHGHHSPAQLASFRERARAFAVVFGALAPTATSAPASTFFGDCAHPRFAEEVPTSSTPRSHPTFYDVASLVQASQASSRLWRLVEVLLQGLPGEMQTAVGLTADDMDPSCPFEAERVQGKEMVSEGKRRRSVAAEHTLR